MGLLLPVTLPVRFDGSVGGNTYITPITGVITNDTLTGIITSDELTGSITSDELTGVVDDE